MTIPYATYKLKILNIKYYKNNRLNRDERNKAIHNNTYPHIENKFQVEIEALVYNIKYAPNYNVKEKFHKNIKAVIRTNIKFYKSRHQYEAYLINNRSIPNIPKIPYKPKEDEIVNEETEKLYKKFENLKQGDKLEITAYNQELMPNGSNIKTNIIKNKEIAIPIQDIIHGKHEYKNDDIEINILSEKYQKNEFHINNFNIIKSSLISKIWSYIQYKIPAIPQLQYHFFYRYIPSD